MYEWTMDSSMDAGNLFVRARCMYNIQLDYNITFLQKTRCLTTCTTGFWLQTASIGALCWVDVQIYFLTVAKTFLNLSKPLLAW